MTTIILFNPQQGHQAITRQLWPMLKANLTAGKRMVVTAQEQEDERSLRQNAFYWAVVLKCTSEQAKINGVGATADGWHLYWKREHLGYKFTKTLIKLNLISYSIC